MAAENAEVDWSSSSSDVSNEHAERDIGLEAIDAAVMVASLSESVREYNEELKRKTGKFEYVNSGSSSSSTNTSSSSEDDGIYNENEQKKRIVSDIDKQLQAKSLQAEDEVEEASIQSSNWSQSIINTPGPGEETDEEEINVTILASESMQDWSILNRDLAAQGLMEVEITKPSKDVEFDLKARKVIKYILEQYKRRGKRIEDIMSQTGGARGLSSPAPSSRSSYAGGSNLTFSGGGGGMSCDMGASTFGNNDESEVIIKRLRRSLKNSEIDNATLKEESASKINKLQFDIKKLTAAQKEMKLMLKHMETKARMKELEASRMNEKIRELVAADRKRLERDQKSFLRITRRSAQVGKVSDSRLLEVIGAYESTKLEMDNLNKKLQSQLHDLNEDLREKENLILKMGYGIQHSISQDETFNQSNTSGFSQFGDPKSSSFASGDGLGGSYNHMDKKSLLNEMSGLNDQVRGLGRELHVAKLQESQQRSQAEAAADEIDRLREQIQVIEMDFENCRLELESRPTLRQWREARQEIKDLTNRLLESDRLMRDSKDMSVLKKYSSVGAAAAQDRDNYRLALHTIDALPKEYTKEVLKDVCRSLSCSDVGLIVPAVEKMTTALSMLPRLEKFARNVLDIIIPLDQNKEGVDKERGVGPPSARKRRVLEDVFPVLEYWKQSTEECGMLSDVVDKISDALRKRAHMPGAATNLSDRSSSNNTDATSTAVANQENHNNKHMNVDEIVAAIFELCQLESQLLFQKKSFADAEQALSLNPEVLNNRIVLHFQYLFQVKRLEGVFPKMNELYVFCSEVTSVLRALRSICRLQPNASPKTILVAVQHLLTSDANLQSQQQRSKTSS